jgi:hypothetical protein
MTNERMIEIAEMGLEKLESIQRVNLREKADLEKNILIGKLLRLTNDTGVYRDLLEGEYEEMSEISKGEWRMSKMDEQINQVQLTIDETKSVIESIKSM